MLLGAPDQSGARCPVRSRRRTPASARHLLSASLLASALATHASPAAADTYVVSPDGTGDFPTIQAALDAAVNGDVILLADGTFTGAGNRDLDFLGKAVTLESQSGDAATCVIDVEGSVATPHRAISFTSGEGAGSVLAAITLTGGYVSAGDGYGGAIVCVGSSPTITDCVFLDNFAINSGGAVLVQNGAPTFTGCRFEDNAAATAGGAAWFTNGTATIDECVFDSNEADTFGGAIGLDDSGGTITGCLFTVNRASSGTGGAIMLRGTTSVSVEACTMFRNHAAAGAGVAFDGALGSTLHRTIIAFSEGSAIECSSVTAPTVTCCVLFANEGGDWVDCVAGLAGQDGNFTANPRFCDIGAGDFTLADTSPCLPGNHPDGAACDVIGAFGQGCVLPPGPNTWLVLPNGTGDFPDIQSAVLAAASGDTIELGDGTFTGSGNRNVDLYGQSIVVRSASGDPSLCTIDCENDGRAFYIHGNEGPETVLSGFTIRDGNATGSGGAIYCDGTSPTLVDLVFVNCQANNRGGALYATNGASPVAERCRFAYNASYAGSAVSLSGATAALAECVLVGNVTSFSGGGTLYASGGGHIELTTSTLYGNDGAASGIEIDASSSANVTRSIIAEGGGAGPAVAGAVTLSCTDIHDNAGGDWTGNIAGQLGVNGNFAADPLFCVPGADLTLAANSPCAPGNHPDGASCERIGAFDVGCPDYVPGPRLILPDGSGDFATIQEGLMLGQDGDTLLLGDGIFTGEGNRDVDFMDKQIVVRSMSGDPATCVIDCQGTPAEPHRGFAFQRAEDDRSRVENVTITGAWVSSNGGAISFTGASEPLISGCVLEGNTAEGYGGAVIAISTGSPILRDCVLRANEALTGGGAIWVAHGSRPSIEGCTITDNEAPGSGAIGLNGTHPTPITRTIVAANRTTRGIECVSAGGIDLTCSNVFGNEGGDYVGCLADLEGVDDNLSADPLFCDPPAGDVTLAAGSPCLPAESPCGALIGALGQGCDTPVGVVDGAPALSPRPVLVAAPNPFRSALRISWNLPTGSAGAHLRIFDVSGRIVRTVADLPASSSFVWDGRTDGGVAAAAGLYFLELNDAAAPVRRVLRLR